MNRFRSHQVAGVVLCVLVSVASPMAARTQTTFGPPSQAEAQSAAAKASPELVNGLAKEIGSTPEQAAGVAGALLGVAKSFLKPEEFAGVSKAVPGIDSLLAAAPGSMPTSTFTPGFAPSATGTTSDPMATAMSAFPKLGISPDMIMKAVPFLSGYLKKYGGAAAAGMLEGLFKKTPAK